MKVMLMNITSNANKLVKQLEEFSKEFKTRLEGMTVRFAEEVAASAAKNTPVGDAQQYPALYRLRQDKYGIPAIEGFHRGAWVYNKSAIPSFSPNINTILEMQNDVFAEADASYRLGDTFYITANGPAYVQLEQGLSDQAPDGILTPTLETIKTAVESDLKHYYDEAL